MLRLFQNGEPKKNWNLNLYVRWIQRWCAVGREDFFYRNKKTLPQKMNETVKAPLKKENNYELSM
jgi:hypothetical protein